MAAGHQGGGVGGRGSYLEGSGGRKEGAKGTLGINRDSLPEGVSVSSRIQTGNLQQKRSSHTRNLRQYAGRSKQDKAKQDKARQE